MKTDFKESQKFTQWWLWATLIGAQLYVCYSLIHHYAANENVERAEFSNQSCILLVALVLGLLFLFLSMQLKTQVDKHGIKMKFFPFTKKSVAWEEIEKVEVLDYGFVGGWGIRIGTKYGTVYNIRGSKGMAIQLKNGKKFLIGTQKESELKNAIHSIYGAKRD